MARCAFGLGLAFVALGAFPSTASAQTLLDALSSAYTNNPSLNAARAQLRSTDESVGIAKSQGRPQISASVSASSGGTDFRSAFTRPTRSVFADSHSTNLSLEIVQPLYAGGRISNGIGRAEAFVRAKREVLRNTEQDVLFDASQAFMEVIRDSALVSLRESNQRFLSEQVRAARDRFQVGEGTRTDVAQAEARLQEAVAQVNAARANLNTSRAIYRQVIGSDPKKLNPASPVEKLIPKSLDDAMGRAQREHPGILASIHNVDAAMLNVKIAEGALLPTVSLSGSVTQSWTGGESATSTNFSTNRQVGVRASIPLYQGGGEYAEIRKAKEDLGDARIQVDVVRDRVRAGVVTAWGQLQSATASIAAARAQVEASQLALNGVIEEQRVGQRTTLDVLNAQSELVNARVQLVQAETNRVIAAFGVVSATGRLNSEAMTLKVAHYNPVEHYEAVTDKWIGLRTPDGR
ncbi:MAG: TolC family outer membrane protein [Hyphomicrobiaceae bacterium]|nr:TolC family outer membrane protein [Hyphomicrobiaceae bacterium]